jgi:hypothetical protein
VQLGVGLFQRVRRGKAVAIAGASEGRAKL